MGKRLSREGEQTMRGLMRSVLLTGCLAMASPGQAQSPPPGEAVLQVPNGQEVRLLVLNNTAGECSGLPVPEVRIQEPPRNGVVIVRFGQTRFTEAAPRCAGREVAGLAVYYLPKAGFTGPDRVRIEA